MGFEIRPPLMRSTQIWSRSDHMGYARTLIHHFGSSLTYADILRRGPLSNDLRGHIPSLATSGLSGDLTGRLPSSVTGGLSPSATGGFPMQMASLGPVSQSKTSFPNLKASSSFNRHGLNLLGRCFWCGEKGHRAVTCRDAKVCFRCGGLGHIFSTLFLLFSSSGTSCP